MQIYERIRCIERSDIAINNRSVQCLVKSNQTARRHKLKQNPATELCSWGEKKAGAR